MKDLNPIVWVKVGLTIFYLAIITIVSLSLENEQIMLLTALIPLVLQQIDVVEYVEEIPKKEPADESTHPSS